MATKKKTKRATSKKTAKRKARKETKLVPTRAARLKKLASGPWRSEHGGHVMTKEGHSVGVFKDGKSYRLVFMKQVRPGFDMWKHMSQERFSGTLAEAKAYAAGMLRVRAAGLA